MSLAVAAIFTFFLSAPAMLAQEASGQPMLVYIGTYSAPNKSDGIYVARFDPATGTLGEPELAAKANRASFLAIHPNRKFLYAVNEVEDANGTKSGAVCAFSIDAQSGKLVELNHQTSGGKGPCFVGLDRDGANAFVANYGDGVVSVIPIASDGSLAIPSARIQHEGKGPHEKRQQGPHAHSFFVDPTNRFALAVDLGIDKVMVYKLDAATGVITPNNPPTANLAPGAGPRHLAFAPNGKHVYVVNEISNTVSAFNWDSHKGAMEEFQTITTLPDDFKEQNTTAQILVHRSGKFLYASNRGHDSIAVFAIDPTNGKLTAQGQTPTGGKHPRNFNMDPTGKWLLAANQNSDNVVVFSIDPSTGALTKTGKEIHVGLPTCVEFLSAQ
jgi:6-phosphogluconolactonase